MNTTVNFVYIRLDQLTDRVLNDIHWVHIKNIFPLSFKISSWSYMLSFYPLQKRKTDVKNEHIPIFFRLVIKPQDFDNLGEGFNKRFIKSSMRQRILWIFQCLKFPNKHQYHTIQHKPDNLKRNQILLPLHLFFRFLIRNNQLWEKIYHIHTVLFYLVQTVQIFYTISRNYQLRKRLVLSLRLKR